MGFGGFYGDANVGGPFTLARSPPKAQLILHRLQGELWQNVSIMHSVESANSRQRVAQYFLGQF
jgi:hypothetical protein